jgi:type I restriction enzyme M protein
LEAVIGLPANLFFGTGIPAAILIFNKGKEGNKNVLFIDSSQHYDSGKNQNRLNENHINHIVETYRKFVKGNYLPGVVEDKFSYVATFDEIKENDFNLNIPRYVDTFEEEPEVDIIAVQKEIDVLEEELKKVQEQMDKYLKELTA